MTEVLCDYGWTLTLTRQPESLEKASTLLQRTWELREHQDINFQLEERKSIGCTFHP
jgi:LuxR family glucitol operon transcriptional activator